MLTSAIAKRRTLLKSIQFSLATTAVMSLASQAHADEYLVGAMLFASNALGASTSHDYQYDTNTSGHITPLDITSQGTTYGQSIAIGLVPGSNTLTFREDTVTPISAYGGTTGDLGLFFSSTNTPYNPASGARQPDLLVSRTTDSTGVFFFPTAGTIINSYCFPTADVYGGATSFTVNGTPIYVTSYSVNNSGAGSITLQIGDAFTATPEPGAMALFVGLASVSAFAAKRRRKA